MLVDVRISQKLALFVISCQYQSVVVNDGQQLSLSVSSYRPAPLTPPQVLRVSSGLPPARATWVVDSSSSSTTTVVVLVVVVVVVVVDRSGTAPPPWLLGEKEN